VERQWGTIKSTMRSGLGSLLYLIVGVMLASSHHYFAHADTLKPVVSAVLAVALWPLLLLGIASTSSRRGGRPPPQT
jgi:hypothetical protein